MIGDKNSLPGLPTGWVWTRVGEISSRIHYGYTAKASSENIGPKLLRITDVQNNSVNWDSVPYCNITEEDKRKYSLVKGDLVFARTGATVGKSFLIYGKVPEAVFASYLIRIILGNHVSNKFVYNYFQSLSYWQQISAGKLGIGQPNVNAEKLSAIIVPLPPLPEQHRIVAKIEELFTKLDAGVEALNKARIELRRYRQAVLKHAFEGRLTEEWRNTHKDEIEPASVLLERIKEERKKNAKGKFKELPPLDTSDLPEIPEWWVWIRLGETIDSMKNGIYKPRQFYNDDGVACLRMYNIENGMIVWKDIKRMNLTLEEIQEYELKPSDILVNRINSRELVGKAAPIPLGLETCVYESKNIRLRLLTNYIESKYVGFWFLVFSRRYFNRNAQQTVGMASINQGQLACVPIPLPPPPEQHTIIEEIERHFSIADEVEKTLEQSLKQAGRLRQSILKMAFEGKLVPQGPGDEPAEILLERIKEERAELEVKRKAKKKWGRKKSSKQKELL